MRSRQTALLAISLALTAQALNVPGLLPAAEAAKKYYPPGYTPPSEAKPAQSEPAAPQVIYQQVPGSKQVIIKTVPVIRSVSKDPLLVLIDERRFYDALRLVDTRLQKSPNNLNLQMTRAQILRDSGSFDEAITQYQAIYDKHRSKSIRANALNGLGWTHYQMALHERQTSNAEKYDTNIQLAEKTFKQANQLAPRLSYPWTGLTQVALTKGDVNEAARMFRRAQALAPGNLQVQLAHADLLLAQNKAEDALQILYGIKKTTTHEPDVYLLLARGSLATGKVDDAIINLKQMLELVPEHVEGLRLLSQSYELKMKPQDAEVTLEKAIALNPADEQSVESLLKIYDQRGENDRAILLLKTLLKDRPGQLTYGRALMERLAAAERWDEAYQDGHAFMETVQAGLAESKDELLPVVTIYSRIIHQRGKGMLDREALLQEPIAEAVRQYSKKRLDGKLAEGDPALPSRLNMLLLDPLAQLPPLPANFRPAEAELGIALQVAFLEGNRPLYDNLLSSAKVVDDRLTIAEQFYEIGDYQGSRTILKEILASEPESAMASTLQEKVVQADQGLQEHLMTLSMLPRKISDTYWEKAASDLLKVGNANWKTHALLAEVLEKRQQPALALVHQKLAAKFAPTNRERDRWLKKADKTARNLNRSKR